MEYQTKDFYLAACLLASGATITRLEQINPKTFAFVFSLSSTEAKSLLQQHWNRELILPTKDVVDAISDIKTRIYSNS